MVLSSQTRQPQTIGWYERLRRVKHSWDDRRECIPFIQIIKKELPDFKFRNVRLVKSGFDHIVLIINKQHVFRFPRNETYRAKLLAEAAVLKALPANLPVTIPRYKYVEETGVFGFYPMIFGKELRPELFELLNRGEQESVLLKVADLLNTLHALPLSLLGAPGEAHPNSWADQRFSHGDFEARKSRLAAVLDTGLLQKLGSFFQRYGGPTHVAAKLSIVHGDVVANHVLLRDDGQVGLIDFSELTIGDPAWDIAVLGSYADWTAPFLIKNCAFVAEDRDLLVRCHQQAVRYWTERLYWRIEGRYAEDRLETLIKMLRSSLRRTEELSPQ